jgi:hypothetical protein
MAMWVSPLHGEIAGVAVDGLDLTHLPAAGSAEWVALVAAFNEEGVLIVRTGDGGAAPAQVEGFYAAMHAALGLEALPSQRQPGVGSSGGRGELSDNLRGAAFPSALGTNVLGNVPGGLEDWHGLTGALQPASWWERASVQYHIDGSFSAPSNGGHDDAMTTVRDTPPMLLQMYCVEAPREGSGEFAQGRVRFQAGATLLLSTTHAFAAAPRAVQRRARTMTAVYTKGFGNVQEGLYPLMSPSGLRPLAPADPATVSSDERYASDGRAEMVHPLVFEHPVNIALGGEDICAPPCVLP